MNDTQINLISFVNIELARLVSCRRLMDADAFVESFYSSVKAMDKKGKEANEEDEWWAGIPSRISEPPVEPYTPLLEQLGEKPQIPLTFETLCEFQKRLSKLLLPATV